MIKNKGILSVGKAYLLTCEKEDMFMKRRKNMYKITKRGFLSDKKNSYIDKVNKDEVQILLSHQMTVRLSQDMRKMSDSLTRSVMEGMRIGEHRK